MTLLIHKAGAALSAASDLCTAVTGLKIRYSKKPAGSIPALGTTLNLFAIPKTTYGLRRR